LLATRISDDDLLEVQKRFQFYFPKESFETSNIQNFTSLADILSRCPILTFGDIPREIRWIKEFRDGTYDIDFHHNPFDALAWCELSIELSSKQPDLSEVKSRFSKRLFELKKLGLDKCYIFGTGPSLEQAIHREWVDGYRIVCNTIVRDKELWKHLEPHFIVAADANYHFGHTDFAKRFREDLVDCLQLTDTIFIYPARFHAVVSQKFREFEDRLIPIPQGIHKKIHFDLSKRFRTPSLGNILPLLLLPLGCTLSKNLYLWGFDGRSPDDKLFWSNSPNHSYPELIHSLQAAYPAFFLHYVPDNDQKKYVRQYHGDVLDKMMNIAEKDGFSFVMMHPSWTSTLMKRYNLNNGEGT